MKNMNCPHNFYIHVPFCVSKCRYCAFYSVACANPDWDKYLYDITAEIKFWANKLGKIQVPSIFFGGGTPSLMPINIFEQIIRCIYNNFDVSKDCEITLESNPGTLSADKLKSFVSNGVNRLSVGVQSLNDEELDFLGRRHNVAQALNLLEFAMDSGLRVSGDFIYGLPKQNVQSVIDLCKGINKIGLKHVSLYELTIEPDTPFGKMNLDMPSNEMMADMYNVIPEYLSLPRYEVSNYAFSGQECIHNKNIWDGQAYVGIGKTAAGRVNLDGVWYEQRGANEVFNRISIETRAVEKIITGIRTVFGVALTPDVMQQINMDWVNSHKDMVVIKNNRLCATQKGLLVLDDITMDLIK